MAVTTVLGRVDPSTLGRTLTHEHLSINYQNYYKPPPQELAEYLKGEIKLKNVGFVQRYPYSSQMNVTFTDDSAVLYDVELFKKHGGGTIVENTTKGISRNIPFLKQVAEETGVNIICGAGFYTADAQTSSDKKLTVEQLYNIMKVDVCEGCPEDVTVKCGILGELASNLPSDEFEKRVIEAAGLLQAELNCPVSFHPGRDPAAPGEIMRRYTEAGGKSSRAVLSHLDRTLTLESDLLSFAADYQCYLQFDLFGTEVLTYQFSPMTAMPSDGQRLSRIHLLTKEGYLDRILMSHDIHTRHRLVKYGGHGYMHIFANILPKMRLIGFSEGEIDAITINNPRRWLTW